MPPIQLSRSERSSLERIVEGHCQPGDIPPEHEEKLLNHGLVRRNVLLLCATPLGQCELLRQRFRDVNFPQRHGGERPSVPKSLLRSAPPQDF